MPFGAKFTGKPISSKVIKYNTTLPQYPPSPPLELIKGRFNYLIPKSNGYAIRPVFCVSDSHLTFYQLELQLELLLLLLQPTSS